MSSPRWIPAVGLSILLAAACYFPALDGEPITEDRVLILDNPATRSPSAALASFTRSFWHGIKPVQPYYRPLPILTWSIERRISGAAPAVFHATNIALHALNAALAALLVLGLADLASAGRADRATSTKAGQSHPRAEDASTLAGPPDTGGTGDSRLAAIVGTPAAGAVVAGALVAVHPIYSEPVAALYGRPDLLAAAGALIFLNLAVRGRWLLSLLALVAALLSKESAIFLPLLVPAAFAAGVLWRATREQSASGKDHPSRGLGRRGTNRGRDRRDSGVPGAGVHRSHASTRSGKIGDSALEMFGAGRGAALGIAAAAVLVVIYLILRYAALGTLVERQAIHPLDNPLVRATGLERWLTPLAVVARTARIALWPDTLCADRGYDTVPLASGMGDPWVLAGSGMLIAAAVVIVALGLRRSPWFLPAAAALLAWLPASNLIVMAPVLMAERLAYMPSLLLCVLGGGVWVTLGGRHRRDSGAHSAQPGPDLRIGRSTAQTDPAPPSGKITARDGPALPAGTITARDGQDPRARAGRPGIRTAVAVALTLAVAALSGRTFLRASNFRTEVAFYENDARACPRSVKAHYNLGNALSRKGLHVEAVLAFERASDLAPTLAIAHSNRGASYLATMRLDEAEGAYRRALDVDPMLVTARASLAGILYMRGKLVEALAEADAALASNPSPGDAAQIRELIDRIRKRLGNEPPAPAPSETQGQPIP